jgi:hypothetical protein
MEVSPSRPPRVLWQHSAEISPVPPPGGSSRRRRASQLSPVLRGVASSFPVRVGDRCRAAAFHKKKDVELRLQEKGDEPVGVEGRVGFAAALRVR